MESLKSLVLEELSQTEKLIPETKQPDLPATVFKDVPDWDGFEHQIWKKGAEIKLLIDKDRKLREDTDIQNAILSIATNRKAKHGRQMFILLLGYKAFQPLASRLATQLGDSDVDGHVIMALYKMRAFGYKKEIEPYTLSKITWIRNYAKKYLSK